MNLDRDGSGEPVKGAEAGGVCLRRRSDQADMAGAFRVSKDPRSEPGFGDLGESQIKLTFGRRSGRLTP